RANTAPSRPRRPGKRSATGQIPHHLAPVGPVSAAPPGKHRTIPRRPGKRSATGQTPHHLAPVGPVSAAPPGKHRTISPP
ncbi:hypothetical protein ACTSFQ_003964, partial [Enterobacter hormaechei]